MSTSHKELQGSSIISSSGCAAWAFVKEETGHNSRHSSMLQWNSCDMYCLKSSKVKWIISRRGVVHLPSFNAPSSELLFKMLKQFTSIFPDLDIPSKQLNKGILQKQGCQPAWTYSMSSNFHFVSLVMVVSNPMLMDSNSIEGLINSVSHPFALLAWPEPHAWLLPSLPLSSRPSPPHVPHQLLNMDRSMRAKKLSGSGASEAWRGHQGLRGREAVKTWRSVDSQGLTKSWNCILKAGEPFRESSLAWGAALPISSFSTSLLSINSNLIRLILKTGHLPAQHLRAYCTSCAMHRVIQHNDVYCMLVYITMWHAYMQKIICYAGLKNSKHLHMNLKLRASCTWSEVKPSSSSSSCSWKSQHTWKSRVDRSWRTACPWQSMTLWTRTPVRGRDEHEVFEDEVFMIDNTKVIRSLAGIITWYHWCPVMMKGKSCGCEG